jgi:hypothetical protein
VLSVALVVSMVIVFGEQFDLWELGWVCDPNDVSC